MVKKKILARVPDIEILKLETTYQTIHRPIAMARVWPWVKGIKKLNAVVKINAHSGGSTIWIKNMSHWVNQPNLWLVALAVHTAIEELKGSMADISANAKPTGMSNTARIIKMKADPGPARENQYGASTSQPPITAPAAIDIIVIMDSSFFRDLPLFSIKEPPLSKSSKI